MAPEVRASSPRLYKSFAAWGVLNIELVLMPVLSVVVVVVVIAVSLYKHRLHTPQRRIQVPWPHLKVNLG